MSFRLVVITPKGVMLDQEIDNLLTVSKIGQIEILSNHAPLITTLEISPLRVSYSKVIHYYAVFGGVMYVEKDKTTIVTSQFETSEGIDIERAKRAKERAEHRLSMKNDDLDVERAKASLIRAITRINVVNKDSD